MGGTPRERELRQTGNVIGWRQLHTMVTSSASFCCCAPELHKEVSLLQRKAGEAEFVISRKALQRKNGEKRRRFSAGNFALLCSRSVKRFYLPIIIYNAKLSAFFLQAPYSLRL